MVFLLYVWEFAKPQWQTNVTACTRFRTPQPNHIVFTLFMLKLHLNLFQKTEAFHEQEIKWRHEARKLSLMERWGRWVRWIRNKLHSTSLRRVIPNQIPLKPSKKFPNWNYTSLTSMRKPHKSNRGNIYVYCMVYTSILWSLNPQDTTIPLEGLAKQHKKRDSVSMPTAPNPYCLSLRGCLATALQHNIVWINSQKRDHCLSKTVSQGCSPFITFSRHQSNKALRFNTTLTQVLQAAM